MADLDGLPACDRVRRGLVDLAAGKRTAEALWLLAASRRLRDLGLVLPRSSGDVEIELYEVLIRDHRDAYGRYNSMRRELASFLEALEARTRRERVSGSTPGDVDPG